MKVKKILESSIDIKRIEDILCANYDENILNILKTKYENKCFKSIYIDKILKILNRSALNCKGKSLDGGVVVDIMFEVSGILYNKGDVIHDCKVIQISNNGIIHAKSKYASLRINNITKINIFKEGDEIPIIVNMSRYNIYDTEISVIGVPLIPLLKPAIIYKITDSTTDSGINLLDLIDIADPKSTDDINEITALEEKINAYKTNKTSKKIYEFFKELLYPFKEPASKLGTSYKINKELYDKVNIDDHFYLSNRYQDDNNIILLSEKDIKKLTDNNSPILQISKRDFINYTYTSYLRDLHLFMEFLETYDTIAKINSKNDFWKLYKKFKV